MRSRERILTAVREAIEGRSAAAHPGAFEGARPLAEAAAPVDAFAALFQAAGGEVVRLTDRGSFADWMAGAAAPFTTGCWGAGVPAGLRPPLSPAPPDRAELGVSMARGAVAETGSLILGSEDGRRAQLLAPVHVVLVRERDVHATLREALVALRGALPAAIGLHSGPSKSADLGQVMVRGVHGPGRVIAAVLRFDVSERPAHGIGSPAPDPHP